MSFQKSLLQSLIWRGIYFISMLLVNVFLSRYLQASAAGVVYYLSNIFSFSVIIAGVCLETGLTYYASGNLIAKNKLIWLVIAWDVLVALLVLVAVNIYIRVSNTSGKELTDGYYYFAVTYIAGLFLTNCAAALFYVEKNFMLPNIILASLNILLILFIARQSSATDLNSAATVLNMYFLFFMLQGVALCLGYLIYTKTIRNPKLPDKTELKKIFRFSSLAMLSNIVFFLVYRIDYLFVNASPACTKADLGNYIQVSKLGQLFLIVPQIIASVVFPRTASMYDRQSINKTIMIIARLFSQLFLLFFVLVLLLGNIVFVKIFGETFNNMQLPMLILIPGIFSVSVLAMLSAYFSGKGKVRVNLEGAVIALIAAVAGAWILVPLYGIIAAAAVSTFSYTINMGYSLYIFYKDYKVNFIEFFRWRKEDYLWIKNIFIKA